MGTSHNSSASGTITIKVKRIDRDMERRIIARFPKAIREFVLYECPFDIAVKSVAKSIKLRGKDETLRLMREKIALDTAVMYGPDHPNCNQAAKGV